MTLVLKSAGVAGLNRGRVALVQFSADERQPFLQAVTRQGAVGGGEVFQRHLVGDVLQDDLTFAQVGAVVQLQQGHITQWVDGVVVSAVGQQVGFGGGGDGLVGKAGLVQRDVGCE